MTGLYPPIEPYDVGMLAVGGGHALYYEQSGNPSGAPVVFLHGGPGAGAAPKHRQFFDPRHYRIVIFDQRGAGRSIPLGELSSNTTQDLVDDIERLRMHLDIARWHVFGGSWGSTLALAYAIAHPGQVASLILRGIFLMRQTELDWFMTGMRSVFPEAWEAFANHVPADERHDLLTAYHRRLTHNDRSVSMAAAKAWSGYEAACARLVPKPPDPAEEEDENYAFAIARIECHYFVNNRFLPDDYLLANIDRIRHIPAVIVQGRYDVVCPIVTAHELSKKFPEAKMVVVPDAGHSASEPGITSALVAATDAFRVIRP